MPIAYKQRTFQIIPQWLAVRTLSVLPALPPPPPTHRMPGLQHSVPHGGEKQCPDNQPPCSLLSNRVPKERGGKGGVGVWVAKRQSDQNRETHKVGGSSEVPSLDATVLNRDL